MKIILFARTLGSTRLCKISQEFGVLSNFVSLPKIRNACFGRCGPLGVNIKMMLCQKFHDHMTIFQLFEGLIAMKSLSLGMQNANLFATYHIVASQKFTYFFISSLLSQHFFSLVVKILIERRDAKKHVCILICVSKWQILKIEFLFYSLFVALWH